MIRLATIADLATLAAVERELFGVDAWDEAALRAELEGPGRRFVVADDLSGYAVSRAAGDLVDLQRIGVAGPARRRGIASALLDDLLRHAVETGEADRVLLEVSAGNSGALAFYLSLGFARIDLRRRYYRDGSDALVLCRSLTRGRDASARMGS